MRKITVAMNDQTILPQEDVRVLAIPGVDQTALKCTLLMPALFIAAQVDGLRQEGVIRVLKLLAIHLAHTGVKMEAHRVGVPVHIARLQPTTHLPAATTIVLAVDRLVVQHVLRATRPPTMPALAPTTTALAEVHSAVRLASRATRLHITLVQAVTTHAQAEAQ